MRMISYLLLVLSIAGGIYLYASGAPRRLDAAQASAASRVPSSETLSVVNGRSFKPIVSPGMRGAVFGSGFISGQPVHSDPGAPRTNLGGVEVIFASKPALLFYVGPTQINLVVPKGIHAGETSVQVLKEKKVIAEGTARVVPFSPALMVCTLNGKNWAHTSLASSVEAPPERLSEDGSEPRAITRDDLQRTPVLVVEATGIAGAADTGTLRARIGNFRPTVSFIRPDPARPGVQLVGMTLPQRIPEGKDVPVEIDVNGVRSNSALIRFETVDAQ